MISETLRDSAACAVISRRSSPMTSSLVLVLELERAMGIENIARETIIFCWITVGMNAGGEVLVVVLTARDGGERLISVRRATAKERKNHEG